ncbi:23S rRNA pseudouridine2457 synthase [Sinobacterium caligoides]|uniref:23S rRNA pseudouridine2457 synthase n=1 Tax=Sinobacterium caligoides TaxID=933926 RepID=A0A3N2DXN2_9GAMM|nr:pseudouridine synthase [Sinobacterium caligoides]ROS04568.1 23S rRNA pseudouridine2457 synthase [Sinobacterium caligoides]
MSEIYLLNKPFNVLSQFTDKEQRATLADFIKTSDIYPAGRLDYDSEGLILLTADGQLAHRIADPKHKLSKTYLVQVEGVVKQSVLTQLNKGVTLNDGPTKPAKAELTNEPSWLWERTPPIRQRQNSATSWLSLTISEGRNRQVRRMTASVGHPTLRLIRIKIGPWSLEQLKPGEYRIEHVHMPKSTAREQPGKNRRNTRAGLNSTHKARNKKRQK